MVWLSGAPVPSEHPDQDQLADLAAEVLPDDVARQLQNHVIGCARCAALLADAEGIRVLLRQSDPEPMPAEVWARLERALSSAAASPGAGLIDTGSFDTGAVDTGSMPATRSGRRARRAAEASSPPTSSIPTSSIPTSSIPARRGGTGPISTTGPLPTGPLPTGSMPTGDLPTSRLSRMSRPTTRARRQAIEEARADRESLLSRLGSLNRVAAVAVVLLVLGGAALAVHRAIGNSGSEASTASSAGSAADSGKPLLAAPIEATGTNYSRAGLAKQIPALVSSAQQFSAAGTTSGANGDPLANSAKAAAKPQATRAQAESGSTAAAAAQPQPSDLLRSPAALQACLTAIGADQQPVAVDLAQYAGQQAAIIVLPADGGGYQVEVVARDCRPGNDGSIDVVTLPGS